MSDETIAHELFLFLIVKKMQTPHSSNNKVLSTSSSFYHVPPSRPYYFKFSHTDWAYTFLHTPNQKHSFHYSIPIQSLL